MEDPFKQVSALLKSHCSVSRGDACPPTDDEVGVHRRAWGGVRMGEEPLAAVDTARAPLERFSPEISQTLRG